MPFCRNDALSLNLMKHHAEDTSRYLT